MDKSNQEDTSEIILTITAEHLDSYKRLDLFLVDSLGGKSRNFIKKIFELGLITAEDGQKLELKRTPPVGTCIRVSLPPPIPSEAQAENIPIQVLFEDEHIIIINKKPGMVVHPAPGNYTGTLVNALLFHCTDLKGIGQVQRPGIVHRLDKGTSGVMVVAKTQEAHEKLVVMFSSHDLKRQYEAICVGKVVPSSGLINSTIGRDPKNRIKMKANVPNGKVSITKYKILKEKRPLIHMCFTLETGRTHQIRVHARDQLKAPLLNDEVYGAPNDQKNRLDSALVEIINNYPYPFLHAKILEFKHPITSKLMSFSTEPEEEFLKMISWIDND